MSKGWKKIDDAKVRHVWQCTEDDCEEGNPEAVVGPDFYEENGEPSCCDRPMTYLRTEIED